MVSLNYKRITVEENLEIASPTSLYLFSKGIDVESFKNFFFQAEDGIRDRDVTGVQTCALPI